MPSKGNRMKFLIIDISFLVGRMFDILNYNGKKKLLATFFLMPEDLFFQWNACFFLKIMAKAYGKSFTKFKNSF